MKSVELLSVLVPVLWVFTLENVYGLCVGTAPPTCLNNIEDDEATEKLNYVLSKYEEAEMKVIGEPFGVHGKLITRGDMEELHIVFKYADNMPYDIIQNCGFVLTTRPGECELIRTFCNTFLGKTPRPLLRRKTIVVCNGEQGESHVEVVDEHEDDNEATTEAYVPEVESTP